MAEWDRQYKAGEKPSGVTLKREFNENKYELFPWLKGIHRDAHSQPFANLQSAYKEFFSGKRKHPRLKKKGKCKFSFYVANDKLKVDGTRVRLPVVGWVRMRESVRFSGKIMSATVSLVGDRWHVSFSVEGDFNRKRTSDGVIGIDVGLKTAVVTSDGRQFECPKHLKRAMRKLRRRSRQHSRKQRGSKNRIKSRQKLARLHARVANQRRDWQHKTTTRLCRENQAIFVETLNVKGMLRNRKLSRALSDVGLSEILRQVEYKSALYGNLFGKVDRWFPSSKTCSDCGCIKETLSLSERVYRCESCGLVMDRDLNAAINIRTVGLTGSYACGQEGSGSGRKTRTKPCLVEAGTERCTEMYTS